MTRCTQYEMFKTREEREEIKRENTKNLMNNHYNTILFNIIWRARKVIKYRARVENGKQIELCSLDMRKEVFKMTFIMSYYAIYPSAVYDNFSANSR